MSPRIAIVGCGAIAFEGHIPALERVGIVPTLVVDPDPDRRKKALDRSAAHAPAATFDDHLDDFDAAIVAIPPRFHAAICEQLLAAGKHVLVEKPIASTSDDAWRTVHAESASSATLRVGHMRRFLAVNRWVLGVIAAGTLGRLRSVSAEEGGIYFWEGATAQHFDPAVSGGGVVIDIGVHVLDILSWWLGDLEVCDYSDDALGGVEANATISLRAPICDSVTVELSRSRELRNSIIIDGEIGSLEVSLHDNSVYSAHGSASTANARFAPQQFGDLFVSQLESWVKLIRGAQDCATQGDEAAKVLSNIETCYRNRRPLDMPWTSMTPETANA